MLVLLAGCASGDDNNDPGFRGPADATPDVGELPEEDATLNEAGVPVDAGTPVDASQSPDGACVESEEVCNGLDDDCDGAADELLSMECFSGDLEQIGRGVCRAGQQVCVNGAWGECRGEVAPADEDCNELDDDCDGQVDEVTNPCWEGPPEVRGMGACVDGAQACVEGEWGTCVDQSLPALELCNGVDEDCDGAADEDLQEDCYEGPEGTRDVGACRAGSRFCVRAEWEACAEQVLPSEEVPCDNTDNDCDGEIDEGFERHWPDLDEDGFGDRDGVIECEPRAGLVDNGDDCDDGDDAIHPDAADAPDLDFVDSNCDGVDGDREELLFVVPGSSAREADGTTEHPYPTIVGALEAAVMREGPVGLALAAGDYPGRLELVDGVGIHGGYDPARGFIRGADQITRISSDEVEEDRIVVLRGRDLVRPTPLSKLLIEAPDHPAPGGSVYGIHAVNAPGLSLVGVTVRVGDGAHGGAGDDGVDGVAGEGGGNGGNCGGAPGGGGISACGATGGNGGRGRGRATNGDRGEPEGCGGHGGARGGAGAGDSGGNGCSPDNASPGNPGAGGTANGVGAGGYFANTDGGSGEHGPNGQPGGGGGGGGGGAVIGGDGGAGGGGGAGGCGGRAGTAGGGGGHSIGVMLVASPGVSMAACVIEAGRGGDGGRAGRGGFGAGGGSGGEGGTGREAFACGGAAAAGHGGDGGQGARGGDGGHGGGGGGGHAYAVVCEGTQVVQGDNQWRHGAGGRPGDSEGRAGQLGEASPARGCD